jgi:DNA-binding IclR family transcriptional regulator
MTAKESYGKATDVVHSVERAIELLRLLGCGGCASVAHLSSRSGIPAPTVYRILRTLKRDGLVRQEDPKTYTLGPELIHLGDLAAAQMGAWASSPLTVVARETGESASLAVLTGERAVFIAEIPSTYAVRMTSQIGRGVPLHATSIGKALLSMLSDTEVTRIVTHTGLQRYTSSTITDLPALLADLRRTRDRGYAIDQGESERGIRCLAVPLFGAPRNLAISVAGPAARIAPDVEADYVEIMKCAANEIVDAFQTNVVDTKDANHT